MYLISNFSLKNHLFQSVIYQCTYPGCREERFDVATIEAHVRKCHLDKGADKEYDSGEEEFYYTGK
jgi:hypothetical protein